MSNIVLNMEYGGYGDRIPCMLFAEDWKDQHPEDKVYISGHHMKDIQNYWTAPYIDGFLTPGQAMALAHKFICTHHLHAGRLYPFGIKDPNRLIFYDIMTELSRLLPIKKQLSLHPLPNIENQYRQFETNYLQGRPYIGLHIRILDGRSCIDPDLSSYLNIYKELLDYFHNLGYFVAVAGDYEIGGSQITKLYPGNVGLQLLILARAKFLIGSNSGFTYISTFLRRPDQSPGLFLNFNYKAPGNWYRGLDIRMELDEYIKRGGGSCEILSYYQGTPGLKDFIFDIPHTSKKIIQFFIDSGDLHD